MVSFLYNLIVMQRAPHELYNLSFPTISNPAHIMPLWVNFDLCVH